MILSNNDMYINQYVDFKDNYKESDYFDIIVINMYYFYNNNIDSRQYKITKIGIESDGSEDQNRISELTEFVDLLNESLQNGEQFSQWQIFYLYKEIFQKLIHNKNIEKRYNYFRGQSDSKYLLEPGMFRNNVKREFLRDFDGIYEELSRLFPNRLKYYPLDEENVKSRESQLSLLQHFGLKTSLLDITSNPYIAMLFMLSENFGTYKEPSFYFFKVEKYNDTSKIFVEVVKNEWNERIIAQRGAFLNFDRAILNKRESKEKISKIPVVKLVLKFDEAEFENVIKQSENLLKNSQLSSEEIQQFIDEIKKDYDAKDRIDNINYMRKELLDKLNEYFYSESDLFPDFEKRIQNISLKYTQALNKKIRDTKIKGNKF